MLPVYWTEIGILVILSSFLIYYYSDPKAAFYAKILVFISFVASLICFVILPIDIYESSLQESEYMPTIKNSWTIIYNINFFMCWLVLPFAQQYEDSGEFTIAKKIKDSFIINGILIGILCTGAIAIVIYLLLAAEFTIGQLPEVFATLVNVFGLSLVSIFLGYGLVSFPKAFYQRRDYKTLVNKCHRQAEAIKCEQQAILDEIYSIRQILQGGPYRDQEQAKLILVLIQLNFKFQNYSSPEEQLMKNLKKKTLPNLHKIVKKRILENNACTDQLDQLVDDLKQISESYMHNNYSHKKIFYTIMFIVTTIISALIFFAELSTFASFLAPINVLGLMGWGGFVAYGFNVFLTVYITYVVVNSVFRIKVYKIFALHKGHSTASSLLFSAINLSRVCYPLCFNYLQITNMPQSSFLGFFGDVNINQKYAIIFPILMVTFALFNLFDIYDKIFGYLGLSSYAFDDQQALQKKQQGRNILVERFKERNIQNNQLEMIQLL